MFNLISMCTCMLVKGQLAGILPRGVESVFCRMWRTVTESSDKGNNTVSAVVSYVVIGKAHYN